MKSAEEKQRGEPHQGGPSGGRAARSSRILIVGLGNPILGDDGVGWRVASQVQAQLGEGHGEIDVEQAALGGLSLMERMLDRDRVILIDALWSGQGEAGNVSVYRLEDLPNPGLGHSASAHDTSLVTALQTARDLGAAVPSRVDIVAIETQPSFEFSEELSPAVRSAVPIAARKVLELLGVH
jgi:hydrogenase maturation protease